MSVEELFGELDALEFQCLTVRFDAPVQGHADFPWTCKHLGILDCGLIHQMVRRNRRVTLYDMQLVTVEISGAVEPGFIVESRHVNNQGVAFPPSDGPAH